MTEKVARSETGGQTRDEILDVAERLIATKGFGSMRMAALIKESGHSASSIYWWFGSKEGVLEAVLERATARFFARAAQVVMPADLVEIVDRMEFFFQSSLELTLTDSNFLRLFILQALLRNDSTDGDPGVVARVRSAALSNIGLGLQWVLSPWGVEDARRVAPVIAVPALIAYDGAFLHTQVRGEGFEPGTARHLAIGLTALAEAVRQDC